MKSKVKIGVIDTDGSYNDINFSKCNISKLNKTIKFRYINNKDIKLSHSECVILSILKENSDVEILLENIINIKNNNTLNDICKSIVKLINMDVDIILLSLGVENKNDVSELFNVCQLAIERNVIIVAAHSNNNITAYPASFNNVIGIKSRDIKSNKFFEYDHVDNDIRFNIKDSSFYHINNRIKKGLVVGNSFLAGTFVGILSNYCVNLKKTNLVNLISNIEKSIGNSRCIKINNEHQILYFYKYLSLKELQVISSKGYVLFKGENNSLINLGRYYSKSNVDNIFFNEFISKKYLIDLIEKIILNKKIDNIYTRYPIFNFFEREQIYSKDRITIKQFIL